MVWIKNRYNLDSCNDISLVAGVRLELTTFGLWVLVDGLLNLCENWSFCWYFSKFINFGFENICAFLGRFLRVYYPIFSQWVMHVCSYSKLIFAVFLKSNFCYYNFNFYGGFYLWIILEKLMMIFWRNG